MPRTVTLLLIGSLVMVGVPHTRDAMPTPKRVVIRMTDANRFVPERVTVSPGDTVEWVNESALPHTATDKPGAAAVPEHTILPDGAEPWDSGFLSKGERFRVVLEVSGEYTYLCTLHEVLGMIGYVTVRESG